MCYNETNVLTQIMKARYLNIQGQCGGLLDKIDEIQYFLLSNKADIVAIVEVEPTIDSTVPVSENFHTYKSSEFRTRLIVYLRSVLPVKVHTYKEGLRAIAIHTDQSSFGLLDSQFRSNAYTKISYGLSYKERRIRVTNFFDW